MRVFLIGALTAKPYAFGARVWELEKTETVDFLDNFGSTVYVETRGVDVIRIIPKINIFGNSDWISDRIRFFFDSLEIQNLFAPYFFDKVALEYKLVDWYKVLLYFKHINIFFFKNQVMNKLGNLFYLNHEDTDLLSLAGSKLFLNNFSVVSVYTYSLYENCILNIDFLNDFCFFQALDFLVPVVKYDAKKTYLFLFGYNIRCEHPILFFRLNEAVKLNKLKIFTFGVSYGLNRMYKIIGLSLKDFIAFFYLKNSKFNKLLKDFGKERLCAFYFLYGTGFINRVDYYIYDLFLKKFFLLLKANMINYVVKYVLSTFNDLNLLYVGYKSSFKSNFLRFNIPSAVSENITFGNFDKTSFFFKNAMNFFLLENDCNVFFKLQNKLALKIFYGHHILKINKGFELYDLLIPSTFLYERDSILLNIFGVFTKNLFVYLSSTNKKDVINIYKYSYSFFRKKNMRINLHWFFFLNENVYYKNLLTYINICETFGLLFLLTNNKFYLYNEGFGIENLELYRTLNFNFVNSYYLYTLNNFYLINTLTKLSKNLLLASKRFI